MADRYLYLIRHGDYNSKDPCDPVKGKGLLPLGRKQAGCTAKRLKTLPVGFTAIYHSDLRRAVETAEIISRTFPELPVYKTRCLRETVSYEQLYKPEAELAESVRAWRSSSAAIFRSAVNTHLKPARGREKHTVLVCHGNLIRCLIKHVLKILPQNGAVMAIHNCSLSVIKITSKGEKAVLSYNDCGHIPPRLQTWVCEQLRQ